MASSSRPSTSADLLAACNNKDANAVARLLAANVVLEDDSRQIYLTWAVSGLNNKLKRREVLDFILAQFQQLAPNDPVEHGKMCEKIINIIPGTEHCYLRYLISVHAMDAMIDHQLSNISLFSSFISTRLNNFQEFAEKQLIPDDDIIRTSKETYVDFQHLSESNPQNGSYDVAKNMVLGYLYAAYDRKATKCYALSREAKSYEEEREALDSLLVIYGEMVTICDITKNSKEEAIAKLATIYLVISRAISKKNAKNLTPEVIASVLDASNKGIALIESLPNKTSEAMGLLLIAYIEQYDLLDSSHVITDTTAESAHCKRLIDLRGKILVYHLARAEFGDAAIARLGLAELNRDLFKITLNSEYARNAKNLATANATMLKNIKGNSIDLVVTRKRMHNIESSVDIRCMMKRALENNDLVEVDRLYKASNNPAAPARLHTELCSIAATIGDVNLLKSLIEKYQLSITYDPKKPLAHFLFKLCLAPKDKRMAILNWLYEGNRYLTLGGGVRKEHLDAVAGKLPMNALNIEDRDAMGLSSADYAYLSGVDIYPKTAEPILAPFKDGVLQGGSLFWLYALFNIDLLEKFLKRFPDIDIDWNIKGTEYAVKGSEGDCNDIIINLVQAGRYDLVANLLARNRDRSVNLQLKNNVGETLEDCLRYDKQMKLLETIKLRHNVKAIERPAILLPKAEAKVAKPPEEELKDKLTALMQERGITHSIEINDNTANLVLSGPADKVRHLYNLLKNQKNLKLANFNEKNKQISFVVKAKLSTMHELWVKNGVFLKQLTLPEKPKEQIKIIPATTTAEVEPIKLTKENHKHYINAIERIFCHAQEIRLVWDEKDNCVTLSYDDAADYWRVRNPGVDPVDSVRIANISQDLIRNKIIPRFIGHLHNVGEARVTHNADKKTLRIYFLKQTLSSYQQLEGNIYAHLAPGELGKLTPVAPAPIAQARAPAPKRVLIEVNKTSLTNENIKDYFSAVIADPEQKFLFLQGENKKKGNKLVLKYNFEGAPVIGPRDSRVLFRAIVAAINKQFPDLISLDDSGVIVRLVVHASGFSLEDLREKLDAVKTQFNSLIHTPEEVTKAKVALVALPSEKPARPEISPLPSIPPLSSEDKSRKTFIAAMSFCNDNQRKNIEYHLEQLSLISESKDTLGLQNPQHYFFAYLLHAFRFAGLIAKAVRDAKISDENDIFNALRNVIRHAFISGDSQALYKWLNPLVTDLKQNLASLKPSSLGQHFPADIFLNREIFATLDDNLTPFKDKLKTKMLGRMEMDARKEYISQYEEVLKTLKDDTTMPENWRLDAKIMLHALIGKCIPREKTERESDFRDLYRLLGHSFEVYYPMMAEALEGLCTWEKAESLQLSMR